MISLYNIKFVSLKVEFNENVIMTKISNSQNFSKV